MPDTADAGLDAAPANSGPGLKAPLDPALGTFLDQVVSAGLPSPSSQTPEEVRAGYATFAYLGRRPEPAPETWDRTINGRGLQIPVRIYRPQHPGPLPVVVFFHGGGWTIGSIETHEPMCQQLAAQVPAVVVSVDYRLAPENPFPAAVEDCAAATAWVAEHATELGADPARLAVAGDSAGGNLAAVVCLKARESGQPAIAMQLLVYPATDLTRSHPSHTENAQGYLLTSELVGWFVDNYARGLDLRDPELSPLLAPDLSRLPRALVVTAGYDPLRDEGEAYALRLREAGVEVELRRYPQMTHAFLQLDSFVPPAHEAVLELAGLVGEALRQPR